MSDSDNKEMDIDRWEFVEFIGLLLRILRQYNKETENS